MAITRFKNSSIANKGPKYDNALAGLPYIPIIGTATDGGNGTSASVAFTGNNVAGAGITYTALSTPGSFTGTGTTSPVTVTGLTAGTSYTFQVKAGNSLGDSAYSAASNSVTPVTPTSFESIATVTATDNQASITFSSIPGTYQHLQIRICGADKAGFDNNNSWSLRINGDTANNYTRHALSGNGSSASASGTASVSAISLGDVFPSNTQTNMMGVGIIDIHDYASTTKNKTVRYIDGMDTNNASYGYIRLGSGLWMSTSAVTSVTILPQYGFVSGSTFALYGIKG